MNSDARSFWLAQIAPQLEPAADEGFFLRRGCRVILWATYSAQSLDNTWEINLANESFFIAHLPDEGFDTIHQIAYEFFKGITYEFVHQEEPQSQFLSDTFFRSSISMRRPRAAGLLIRSDAPDASGKLPTSCGVNDHPPNHARSRRRKL